jgi:hypothetical protein
MTGNEQEAPKAEAADRFEAACDAALHSLREVVDSDWSVPAGTLEWTCRQTLDHMIDCLFSYGLQLAARAQGGFLPFEELHALPEATIGDRIEGLRGIGAMFTALIRSVPEDSVASDGLVSLGVDDWAARGAYEILLHTHDVLEGHGGSFEPPAALCSWVLVSPKLWMLDRHLAAETTDSWKALLLGSGRPGRPQ